MTTALTPANQLTLLRMLLIPAFVILVVYGHLGWALVVFIFAGITDALDGVIARRSGQKTSLGAWLDPMADKLLLVTTFVVLTLPGLGLANRLPIWLTVLIISRDVGIVLTVAIVNLAIGPRTFQPSMFGKVATATYILTAVVAMLFNYLRYRSMIVEPFVHESPQELAAYRAVLDTSAGPIAIELFADKAPNTVRQFMRLAAAGVYDSMAFHRVAPGFVIQTGSLTTRAAPLTEKQQTLV